MNMLHSGTFRCHYQGHLKMVWWGPLLLGLDWSCPALYYNEEVFCASAKRKSSDPTHAFL